MTEKFRIQSGQYEFPYHYIPHFRAPGLASRQRFLKWGLEYLCYMEHAKEVVERLNPSSVLDVGCGDGFFLGLLSNAVSRKCGVDLVDRAIGFARLFNPHIDFRCANVADLDEQFDVVTSIEVLEHIPDEDVATFVGMLQDRVRPGGHLFISVPSVSLPLNKKHYRHYDGNLLLAHVRSGAPDLRPVNLESVFWKADSLYRIYLVATCNRFWTLESDLMNQLMWRRIWRKRIRPGDEGAHVIGLFRKS